MLENILKLENATKLGNKEQKSINGGWRVDCYALCGPLGGKPDGNTGRCDCY